MEYVRFQTKEGLGSPALHVIVNPRPDGVGVASLSRVGGASMTPAILLVPIPGTSLLAMTSCCISCHADAIARFSVYLLAACLVNVVARFCVFLAVIFDSGMCADSA